MTNFIYNFHFLRPWFLLLLVVPLFLYFKTKSRQIITDSAWAKVCDKTLLDFLLIKKQEKTKKVYRLIRFLIFLFMPLALAGPCWKKQENPTLSVNNPLIIALNMSSGMWSKDITPSRIERAKFLIKDILNEADSTETGLEVYSREPFIISPVSEDKSLVDNLLPAVTYDIMPENGDRLDRAIDLAVERLKKAHYTDGNIIVLTYDVGERFDLALESASKASAEGYDINVIDLNSDKSAKLEMIAQKGQGVYAGYNENLNILFNKINNAGKNKFKQSENMQTVWHDYGYYVLFIPALLMFYFFRRGAIWLIIFSLLYMQNAMAGWFLNNNQEAMRAFEQGDYKTATQKFEAQNWKAGSAYKNGEYEKAAQIYSSFPDTENLYNYGNALAKSGKIKEAIEKYEEVLKQNPEHEDAKFNLEYLKQQQQNQNQNQQNNQDKKQNQDQNQDQNQQQNENSVQKEQSKQQDSAQSQQLPEKQNTDKQEQQNSQDNKNEGEQSANSQEESPADGEKTDNENTTENQSPTEQEPDLDDKEQQVQTLSEGDKQDENEQKSFARKQKYREIKEDKGGLLRAFIKKEYDRKRYRE